MATNFGFIDKGRIVKEISAADLEAVCRKCTQIIVSDTKILCQVLDKIGVEYSIQSSTEAEIYGDVNVTDLTRSLFEKNCRVQTMRERNENLETYYINLIGGGKNE